MPEDLQSLALYEIHEEKTDAAIRSEIARCDVLFIPAKVGEAERLIVQDVNEALWTTAVLDVRPAGLPHGRHVEVLSFCDKTFS